MRHKGARTHLFVMILFLLGTPVLSSGQQGRPTPDPYPHRDPIRVPPAVDFPISSPRSTAPRGMAPSSVIEIKSSLRDLDENIRLLRDFDTELLEAANGTPATGYGVIMADASDIRKIALRLLRSLSLPRPVQQAAPDKKGPAATAEQLEASIAALDEAIQAFMKNPVLKEPRTVDADLLSKAGTDLEAIVSRGTKVREQSEQLASNGGAATAQSVLTMTHLKSKLKPNTLLQLSLECDAWSMGELLSKPSELKGKGSITVLRVEAQTKRHQLVKRMVIPIEDCVDAEADENATDRSLQYAAIVKDFTSFEVKGRVFAYQVTYEIGFTRDGQITKRFQQPVSFYYVDETGDGSFDLLKGPLQFGLIPDWATELARKH